MCGRRYASWRGNVPTRLVAATGALAALRVSERLFVWRCEGRRQIDGAGGRKEGSEDERLYGCETVELVFFLFL